MDIRGPLIGIEEARDIRAQVALIMRDLGSPEPPLRLDDVMELLDLDFRYYSNSDLSRFDELAHTIRMAGKRVLREPGRILDAIKKAKLNALWLPNGSRIFMDETVPTPKQRHLKAHEIAHSITPWHKSFLFGDSDLTLTAHCHCMIETEANYGAGQLLFMGERFKNDARDCELKWSNIHALKKRYANTLTTTLWHVIEEHDPDKAIVGMIGRHPKYPNIGNSESGNARHFIRSRRFHQMFGRTTADDIYRLVANYVSYSKRGPCGNGIQDVVDDNGETWEFSFESFCNTYDLLTLGVVRSKKVSLFPVERRSGWIAA